MENSIFLGKLHTLYNDTHINGKEERIDSIVCRLNIEKERMRIPLALDSFFSSFHVYKYNNNNTQRMCFILLLFLILFYPRVINLFYIECVCVDRLE